MKSSDFELTFFELLATSSVANGDRCLVFVEETHILLAEVKCNVSPVVSLCFRLLLLSKLDCGPKMDSVSINHNEINVELGSVGVDAYSALMSRDFSSFLALTDMTAVKVPPS